ncbi:outer membrane lipid asymmetry maintenance protein MlaD [Bordetella holmesii]|uniref:Outer membrane lipid asymmetry maintenance protein MlaD n=2 Tax=Bordetella holmesii TaxID=35814 RepID=A0A158M985_9BORD|nr:outer membrane lipid asymmetry maintenance protein MlaD [Bordetella holmesii]AIT26246.1 mce related family protein [Bordetella holmesii 44057]EWM42694.1 mce related family protein [Bordetella holmesii 41130]EWM46817.1 mce related family protein [Bordetella holmesii 35009]EWM50986.1 mce related family protein [Bordetella holmesii 70147]AMD45303.1 outer membrane lipid asymmetry maintenance protein MlaD [Bordetella holmesii H558]
MSREKTDFWVGLFVLLGAAALVFLALRAGNLSSFSFAPTYTLTASFDNIGGLKVRAPVKSAGVVVGRVSQISFDDKSFQAVVTMNLEVPYQFPSDSSASILTSGLLGEQYIGVTPGSEEENFADGGKIRYTQSAVVLEQLISKFLYGTAEKQGTAAGESGAQ